MDPKTLLRQLAPSAYRLAVWARRGPATKRIIRLPTRMSGRRLFKVGGAITVDVSERMGLGGILTNAGNALYVARKYEVDLALRFTSPTYAPSWGQIEWLESYFVRLGRSPGDAPVCNAEDVPALKPPPTLRDCADLVWSTIRIRDDIVSGADQFIQSPTFAAVHFRGSDKFLDSPRVATETMLSTAEREMEREELECLFVATDEPVFVAQAQQRFGSAMFSLPLEAVASENGTPAHFGDIEGETKAREALTTMIILSRSQLLLKTESLLSDWAMTLANNQRVVLVKPQ